MIKAITSSHLAHLKCFDHRLNTAVPWAIKDTANECLEFKAMFCNSKKIVKKIKHSNHQHYMKASLKQYVKTRWCSLYDMFTSIETNYDILNEHLRELSAENLLSFSYITLEQVCDYLQIINECTLLLSSS